MVFNYFLVAIRQLKKKPLYTSLNIFGLGLGVAACLLITLYIIHELSFDRWNPHAGRIVRPTADIKFGGHHFELATVGSIIGPDAARDLPEIRSWCRIREYGSYLVKREGEQQQNIREEKVLTVDSTFFDIFPLPVIAGDPVHCLTQPGTVALSRSRAEKYFSSPQMALGQTLLLENKQRWLVTAVYEDFPGTSHFKADFLLSMNGNEEVKGDPPFWASNNNFVTYFLLDKGVDKAVFAKKFDALATAKTAVTAHELIGTTIEDMAKSDQFARFVLQDLTDIHLYSDLSSELQPNGNIQYVRILVAIAAFILLIACINFMNLATARSAGRAREVGVRKALGSRRSALIGQFLSEAMLLSTLAVVLGVVMAALAMPVFKDLAGRELAIPWSNPVFWLSLVGAAGLTGLLSGSYPAFFLSAFQSVQTLKGDPSLATKNKGTFRSALVVFQFAVSVTLIIATMLVFKQLDFIQNKKIGFDKSQVIVVEDAYALDGRVQAYKDEMLKNPAIESATISSYLPVPSNRSDQTFSPNRAFNKDNSVNMQRWRVDSDYLKTLGMSISAGRNFDPGRSTDSTAVVINESAARNFGFPDPVGQKIYTLKRQIQGAPQPEDFEELTIIGVVKDFHYESLRSNIGSLCLQLESSTGRIAFRFKGSETATVIAALEKQWKSMAPDQPFKTAFLDEAFGAMYAAENRVGKIAGVFALLSVLISCLGQFGLAAFTAEQRTKEIGIRKVLGASVAGITGLLAKDFLKLVLIALLISSPIAYYVMQNWLQDFAYHMDIPWWMFALAGVLAVGIAFLTVSYQAVKAALANPVKSLRSE